MINTFLLAKSNSYQTYNKQKPKYFKSTSLFFTYSYRRSTISTFGYLDLG